MVKLIDKQNIFNCGILSTKLHSRDDLKQYNNGIYDAMNFVCSRYGPMEKRVGTNFIWDLGNPEAKVFLLPFVFSITQSLLLEFLDNKIRFYTFDGREFGPIADPELPDQQYEIETPFAGDQLYEIDYVQSFDVIYLAFADGKTPPYTLSRYANNNWKLDLFQPEDGPYLDQNYSTNKKVRITDTATGQSTIELIGFSLTEDDIGRWIRICTPRYNDDTFEMEDKWSYGKITAVDRSNIKEDGSLTNGAFTMKITVQWEYRNTVNDTPEESGWMTSATTEWRLGVWHSASGNPDYPVTYPTKVSIHQQRLVWAGMTNKPWIWASNTFAYNNYAPNDFEGEIKDTSSITYDVSTDKVSEIFWIKSLRSLLIGTELGELRMYSAGTALTPADVVTAMETSYGAHNSQPIVSDDTIIFIQRLQRSVRSLSYDYNVDAFVGPELTILAENLTTGGIKKLVFQKEPNYTVWAIKEDGSLLTLTYDRSQDVIGWSKQKLAGTEARVIDLAILPSNDYQQDMVLLCVERTINGQPKRYLELLSKNFTDDVTQSEGCFLDCSTHVTSEETFDIVDGLDFLEGETVRVTDEGAYVKDYVVKDGSITLDYEVKDIWIGLPYEAYFETLERDFQDKQISTKMSKLRVYKLRMYMNRTIGVTVQRLDKGTPSPLVTFDPSKYYDQPPALLTGRFDIAVPSAWDCDYRLRIISEPGLPCTITGIIIGVEINEI